MKQKVVITDSELTINNWLDKGWKVVSITAQYISTGSSYTYYGKFCFVIEKLEINNQQ